MNSAELIDSFSEFKEFKNIDRPTMMKVLGMFYDPRKFGMMEL